MRRYSTLAAIGLTAGAILLPGVASADPPCGRGWRKHEWCGGYVYGPRPYVAYPPVYYAPPPRVYYPPPPVYYAPPAYPVVPSLSFGVNIPLR